MPDAHVDDHVPLSRHEETFHFVGNVRFLAAGGGHARGEVYCLAHHLGADEDGTLTRVVPVVYTDEYQFVDGRWRFASREIRQVWRERRPAVTLADHSRFTDRSGRP